MGGARLLQRGRPRRVERPWGLTARQWEVTECLMDGHTSDTQLAERLGISVGSVRTLLQPVYDAVGVSSRIDLLAVLYERRLRQALEGSREEQRGMVVIGDVHGRFAEYEALLRRFEGQPTLQLGDLGVGFPGSSAPAMGERDWFFRGNQDNPEVARVMARHLGEGGEAELGGIRFFYVPGGYSIDAAWRVEAVSWWRGEQLSVAELDALVDAYTQAKPELMITHEAPEELAAMIVNRLLLGGRYQASRTAQALQAMLSRHRPKRWIYGHYHIAWERELEGTHFQCLPELGWVVV